ncbi:MAG TPA: CHASE domain-containing protein [Arenimonas sp.]|uniref:CHASE domain-containing protein n=1 Tax=Arenimonas sp. TaxID=1872635 RepID=UPI002D7F72A2|nr:CHASE domain-containing protein [Arenimonas sp.]HEU0153826.1 CHASE domain-containing protein [Arenimonas sp.]
MPQGPRSAAVIARLALGIGLVATALGAWQVKRDIERDARAQMGFAAEQVSIKIGERLRAYEMILRGGAGLFAGSNDVSREDWRRFVEEFQASALVPGVQGIGFARAIAPDQLAAHEAAVRAEGFPDYRVRPEGPRELYTSILYLEPFRDRNLRAFGYDMYSEPVRRAAMVQARDTGEAALSGKVVLVQETEAQVQPGTLMYVAVYDPSRPTDTPEQRRDALLGWAYSPYRMNDLMAGLLQGWQSEDGRYLHLRIYDGESIDPASLLFDSAAEEGLATAPAASDAALAARRTLRFHGRPWRLEFSRSAAAPGISYLPAWLTALGGLLLTGLLYGLLVSLSRTREHGLQLAHTLTEAVLRREKQLEESEFRWRFALEGSGSGLWDWNLADDTVWYSSRFKQMLGHADDDFGDGLEAWSGRIHPEDRERTLAAANDYLAGRTTLYSCEHRLRHKDGHYVWVLGRGMVVDRDAGGKPRRMIGTDADISASKALEASLRHSQAELEEAQRIAEFASWTLERDSGRVTWTPQLFHMLGLPPDPGGKAPPFDTHHRFFSRESHAALSAAVERLLADGTPYELELEMIRADGSHGWMLARGEPVRDAEGRVTGIHGVATDITARNQARRQIEQLNRLYAALSECNWAIVHCASEPELLERVCDVLVRHGGIDTAWVGLLDPATGAVRSGHARGEGAAEAAALPASADPGEPAGRGPFGTAARELRPVWVDELMADLPPGAWREAATHRGWRSAAFLPLRRGREAFAVLSLFSTETGWGDANLRQLVEQIGSNVNFAVEKLGIESEARTFRRQQNEAADRFRLLVEQSRVGAFIMQDGVIRYANLRAGEILGLPGPDGLIGRRLDDLADPEHRDSIGRVLADLTGGRVRAAKAEFSAPRPDGSRVRIGVNATLATDGEQAPVLGLLEEPAERRPAAGA